MEIIKTGIEGLLIIKPKVFEDARGYFFESYNKNVFVKHGIDVDFKQDNQSKSKKGVLRGLHLQNPPHAQGKLVIVVKGAVLDVGVDIRKGSPTYGKWESCMLTEQNKTMFWIPAGFAHGFITLEDDTIFSYKCTETYSPESEQVINWDDPDLNINWQLERWDISQAILSERDVKRALSFRDFDSPFK